MPSSRSGTHRAGHGSNPSVAVHRQDRHIERLGTQGVAVGRNVLRKRAMEMLLTGDMVDAHQALDWGLVNRVVPAENLVAETDRLARQLAEKPPVQLAAGKRAFYAQMDLGVAQAYELASGVIAASFAHQEGREGMDAFIEKRDPPGRSRQQP